MSERTEREKEQEDARASDLLLGSVILADTPHVAHLLVLVLIFLVDSSVRRLLRREALDILCTPCQYMCIHIIRESDGPLTFPSYSLGCRMSSAAASPLRGSLGLGYLRSWGRKTSKILIMSTTQRDVIEHQLAFSRSGEARTT